MFKRLTLAALLCAAVFSVSADGQSVASATATRATTAAKTQQPHLIESASYTNSAGVRVHSPAHTTRGQRGRVLPHNAAMAPTASARATAARARITVV